MAPHPISSELFSTMPPDGVAVVAGATGAVGKALCDQLRTTTAFVDVVGLSRSDDNQLDLKSEETIRTAAEKIGDGGRVIRLFVDATGFLHGGGFLPEKTWRQLDAEHMAEAFAINAIGPALLMKHFLPLLPRSGKSVFATLSAKVGSIGDNQLGGWYGYRASKAALNQIVRTAAIELWRGRPEAICVALHPGTVDSPLSRPFSKSGLTVRAPDVAAAELLTVIDGLNPDQSGGFFDYTGQRLPW